MSGSVERWLGTFMCQQYADKFEQFGYKTLQSVCQLQPPHLHVMQIAPEHCEKILENVSVLKQSMYAGANIGSDQPESDIVNAGNSEGRATMSVTGSMNQYPGSNMYAPNPHMLGNGYSQHPPAMGSAMPSMQQTYPVCYQGQGQGQGYPQYAQPVIPQQQGYSSSYAISAAYPDPNGTYPTNTGSVPMHHHIRFSQTPQNPQYVADSIFQMAAKSYGPSRSAKYAIEPPVGTTGPQQFVPRAPIPGQHYNQYHNSSPMYPQNSAALSMSPMPIRSPPSVHSNPSVHSRNSSPGAVQSPHGKVTHQMLRSPVMGMTNQNPSQSQNNVMRSPVQSSPAPVPISQVSPSPSHSQERIVSPKHNASHYLPTAYSSASATQSTGNPYYMVSCGDYNSQSNQNNPLHSLQKLVMLPEQQVVDPKSVVHDAKLEVDNLEELREPGELKYVEPNCIEEKHATNSENVSDEGVKDKKIHGDIQKGPEMSQGINSKKTADVAQKKHLIESDQRTEHCNVTNNTVQEVQSSPKKSNEASPHKDELCFENTKKPPTKKPAAENFKKDTMCPPKKRGRPPRLLKTTSEQCNVDMKKDIVSVTQVKASAEKGDSKIVKNSSADKESLNSDSEKTHKQKRIKRTASEIKSAKAFTNLSEPLDVSDSFDSDSEIEFKRASTYTHSINNILKQTPEDLDTSVEVPKKHKFENMNKDRDWLENQAMKRKLNTSKSETDVTTDNDDSGLLTSLPSTSTPSGETSSKKKRGRPVGSKNKMKKDSSPIKTDIKLKKKPARKRKGDVYEFNSDNESLVNAKLKKTKEMLKLKSKIISNRLRTERAAGPLIRVKGSKENPESCTVVNVPADESNNNTRIDKKIDKNRHTFLTDATRAVMIKSTAVPSSKTSSQANWVCALCGQVTNYNCLGDLLGPYYLPSTRMASSISSPQWSKTGSSTPNSEPKKRGRKKKVPESGEVSSPEVKKRRRSSVKRSLGADGLGETEVWLHEDCLVWCQGVYLIGDKLFGLEEALAESKQSMCTGCRSHGAFIGCHSKGCNQKFHFMCAKERDCLMDEENFNLLCPKHKERRKGTVSSASGKSAC